MSTEFGSEALAVVPSEGPIDLRERGNVPAHTYAYYQLRDIRRGELREVLAEQEPTLLMESVSHQLRHEIHWEVVDAGPPLWRVQVQHRDDVPATSLVDVLERDHLRLDRLFGEALHATNEGDLERAARRLQAFSIGLRRHLHVENDVLAPAFVAPRDPQGGDPTSIMLSEHEELLAQVELLEAQFSTGLPAVEDVAPLFALLSGQLAKHEAREELNLFPNWGIAIRHAPPGAEEQVVRRVQGILAGDDDADLGLTTEPPAA
ncbi:MAG: hemerythrin domain-containing protein [Gammaproteobacteria bacterium]